MTNFSGTSGWFFRYQIGEIPTICLIIRVLDWWNSINLVIENSKNDTSLSFGYKFCWTAFSAFGTPHQGISRGKELKKWLSKNYFSLPENWCFLENRPIMKEKINEIYNDLKDMKKGLPKVEDMQKMLDKLDALPKRKLRTWWSWFQSND